MKWVSQKIKIITGCLTVSLEGNDQAIGLCSHAIFFSEKFYHIPGS